MRVAPPVVLTAAERDELVALVASSNGNAKLAQRARIVLMAADGAQNKSIAHDLGIGRVQVARWRERYVRSRIAGIKEELPRGAPPIKLDVARLVSLTTEAPGNGEKAWSTRKLAAELGVSAASVSRHWRATGIAPQAGSTQRGDGLPELYGRQAAIVGLYIAPPEHALVFALDERIEASPADDHLARAPEVARPVHAWQRHLATSLITSLRALMSGSGGTHVNVQRHVSWLGFLGQLETRLEPGKRLLVVADNHLSHHHPAVQQWLCGREHFQVRLAPNGSAWLRLLQGYLRDAQAGLCAGGLPEHIAEVLSFIEKQRVSHGARAFHWFMNAYGAQALPLAGFGNGGALDAEVRHAAPMEAAAPATGYPMSEEAQPDRAVRPVASTKLLPPRSTRRMMARDALMTRLLEARRHRCVVIQGQAGSGKTSTMIEWRKSLISMGFDVSWLSLSSEDNEPARFFDCLLASIAEADPAVVRDAALLVAQGSDDTAIEHWVITLVQALGKRQRHIMLMIDDLHHVSDPRIFEALQWLLDYAPPQLHLALCSRSALALSLDRLRSQGAVSEFDMRDLRFSEAESERYLREQLGSIEARDAAALHALTDGWVAGLQLFAVDLRTRQGSDYPVVKVHDPRTFANYFECEVLLRLAADDLDMLTRVAVCHRFSAPLCASVVGREEALAHIRARLAQLEADNLFITQVGSHDREIWYRIHPLLRETLLTRLAERDAEALRCAHAVAWRWFEAHGQIDDAVFHAVKAGDPSAAASMVERCAQALLAQGELNQLSGLLRMLPLELVQKRFALHIVMAYVHLYSRNFQALGRSLDQLEASSDALDEHQRYALRLLRAALALQQDDTDAIVAMLPELRAIPDDADDFAWNGRSNVLSWLHMSRGEYDEARAVLDNMARRAGAPRSNLLGRCMSALSLSMEGRIKEAEKIIREVLDEAERQGPPYVGVACMAASLLADTLYELNDIEAACQLLEPRIGMLERVSLPEIVMRAFAVLSNAHWAAGRRAQACAWLDRLESYAGRYGLDRVLAEALVLRLRRHLEQVETERANTVVERLATLEMRYAGAGPDMAARIRFAAARACVEMCLHTGDYAGLVGRLEALVATSEQNGRRRLSTTLRLQLAMAHHGVGNLPAAGKAFVQALRQGHALGLMRTLLDVAASAPGMFAALASQTVADPVLAFYGERLRAAQACAAALPVPRVSAAVVPVDALSEREREILALLAQAMSNKKIATVLNVSAETVKWHLKNIYLKLGVGGRGGAAARFRDLSASEAETHGV
ncbi:LuxR C-terminal-related transcriptional regulator [Paraburkholderia sacchari]|uniref:LuxR C-terminal-related transcriptional regulator n=1 Tax=Paraburkholderia sacchari TaxID=159450 RepID=UPI003D968C0F